MSSILTNTSAMVALQTMKNINTSLNRTQQEISTGKTVATAKDNAAVWAISKVMESDVKGFKGISDSLSLGSSTIAVAREASETVTDLLTEIKGKIVAAQEENVDRSKMQTDITALRDQIASVVGAAQFNGLNLIQGTEDVNVLSSLDRAANGNVTASNITVNRQDLSTTAGTYGSGTSLAANAVVADSASAIASTGNTAQVTFAATWAAGDTASLSIAGVDVSHSAAGTSVTDIATAFAGAINALGLEGVTASNSAGVLTITSTRAFEGLSVTQTSTTAGDGTSNITQVNGAAPAGSNTATSSTISQRAERIDFSTTAAVNEGDGYKVTVGTASYNYIAGKGETMEDVARGLKVAIDSAGLSGVTTSVAQSDTGAWQLNVDNDGSGSASLAFSSTGNAGGEASGGLFGLDSIDVRTNAGADAALTNIETMITRSIDAAAAFGSAQNRIDIQNDFVGKLTDAMKAGIGTLVDADMEEASARLQALQVQQQLATQALSIANQAPQNIMALFR
ncbi:flagellin N-terminal helical domain-containing protein [Tabrizicola oligotrophica]|uniref:Flagellin n=1 Tax=Tabrizicola oligotrophica TaxID=2710650 RepID=A0A6M0QVW4_9RHOB|nr:flagellin [Tabrizicola oligotrophica]NEY91131.1 flagellin [Tabrizicola oligotrophica]